MSSKSLSLALPTTDARRYTTDRKAAGANAVAKRELDKRIIPSDSRAMIRIVEVCAFFGFAFRGALPLALLTFVRIMKVLYLSNQQKSDRTYHYKETSVVCKSRRLAKRDDL